MTADDARKLTEAALAPDSENVGAVLRHVYAAVTEAAKAGDHECRTTLPDTIRANARELDAAIAKLCNDGFEVDQPTGQNRGLIIEWRRRK